MNTYQLLDLIRRRLPMYTGSDSLQSLQAFISGYDFGIAQADLLVPQESPDFGGFHDWVANKLGYSSSTSGWRHMIAGQRVAPEEEVWLFFQLLDEYRELHPRTLASVAPSNLEWLPQPSARSQPQYTSLVIEEVLPAREWVALTAKRHNDILYQRGADNVAKAIQEAERIFGLSPDVWVFPPAAVFDEY